MIRLKSPETDRLLCLFYIWKRFQYRSNGWWKFCNIHLGKIQLFIQQQGLKVNQIQLEASRGTASATKAFADQEVWAFLESISTDLVFLTVNVLQLCCCICPWPLHSLKEDKYKDKFPTERNQSTLLWLKLLYAAFCLAPLKAWLPLHLTSVAHIPSCHSTWWAVCLETASDWS